jgi:hypothetical protein
MNAKLQSIPDAMGRFGLFGGRYVPETLIEALNELTTEYEKACKDEAFQQEFHRYLNEYVGRPSRLYFAERLTKEAGGAKILLKREDLNHTGAHKINNSIGQALLAKRMGKKRIIAETGAGQHGVATATACALFNFPCRVYMGEEDIRRQKLNVFKMQAMGAEVCPVTTGSRTLRDAVNEAMENVDYLFLSVDVDVADPAYAPGTGSPEPGGLTSRELLRAVRRLSAEVGIVGMDVVEVAPVMDSGNSITALLASRCVLEALTGTAMRKLGITSPDYLDDRASNGPN